MASYTCPTLLSIWFNKIAEFIPPFGRLCIKKTYAFLARVTQWIWVSVYKGPRSAYNLSLDCVQLKIRRPNYWPMAQERTRPDSRIIFPYITVIEFFRSPLNETQQTFRFIYSKFRVHTEESRLNQKMERLLRVEPYQYGKPCRSCFKNWIPHIHIYFHVNYIIYVHKF